MSGWAATLMVDASWDPELKVGGYGYWIASSRGKLGGGQPLKGVLESSNLAEMQAICNVLYIARSHGFVIPGDEVLIQTDCRAAIQGLSGFRETVGRELEAKNTFNKLSTSLFVDLRHVKGHTGRTEAKYLSNHHCDARAYRAMREARKLHRKGLNA